MEYLSKNIVFESNQIYFTDDVGNTYEVMMRWEDEIMLESANYVCQNGGDILEIGFGMGISANHIQSHNVNTHTIVENHPDIIPKALEWAKDKPNVQIVEGSWYDNLNNLGIYDGIFYDTYGDGHIEYFDSSVEGLTKTGTLLTFWNNIPDEQSVFNFDNITYQLIEVTPPNNSYFTSDKYYLPKKQF